ncbi:MAG: hypothetical protein HY331_02640 [Chloroflexi bacterium]|nr:hypothetical protein [Chloroflexota bacterium]
MTAKERLHRLVDELSESELDAAERFLEYLRNVGCDPMLRALMAAPLDDEPVMPEEDAGAAEAWQEHLRGESLTAEQAKKLLLP